MLLKPNFNTADPPPASTHNETLASLIEMIWQMGARKIMLGERSFPPTKEVMEKKNIYPLMKRLDVEVIDFDQLPERDWVLVNPPKSHWTRGFRIARPILESECLVSTCCLKTHQFGGVFTMSLKLHVGAVPTTRHGFHYMRELHGSPHQQKMIAEINQPFSPALIIMDGVEAFVDGGPAHGKKARGNVVAASTDRIAIDAVGLAILKKLNSNTSIMGKKIFEQEQISRAVELNLGVSSAEQIELVPADEGSIAYCEEVAEILRRG